MGKPAFLFTDYHPSATVTATDTLTGTDADNILLATEDTVWSPADATGTKDITIDLFSAFAFDYTALLGENLNGLQVLTTTSTDNFATDTDYGLNTDVVTNGDFATGDLTGWTTASTDGTFSANVNGAVFSTALGTPPDRTGVLSQTCLTSGKYYLVTFEAKSVNVGSITVNLGTNQGTPRTANGTYSEVILSNGTDLSFDMVITSGAPPQTIAIDEITVYEFSELTSENNVALISHATTSSDRYINYNIANPATSLQIAHIAPDTLIEQPWLEDDWGTEGVQSEFKNLISVDGYYLGTTQTKTMRDININFGEITDTEYTVQVEPWVTSRIKTSSAFFFIPDVDDLTEIYFCWLVDGQGFKAPLKQGVRMAEAIRCLTRLA